MSNNIGYLQIRNIDCGPSVCMVLLESRRRIFKAKRHLAADDCFAWDADRNGGKRPKQEDHDHGKK